MSAGSHRAVVRHTANYLAAVSLIGAVPDGGRLVDVGGGVGAFAAWASHRLGTPATLVDSDAGVLRVASVAFPELDTALGMNELAPASAWLVTAMEVVEHIPPAAQLDFVRGLARLVAPGGTLVVSTPDESRYLGGWSGYAPHVGVLTARRLETLLAEATGRPVELWRLEGDAFHVGAVERVVLPLANRFVGTLRRTAPKAMETVSHLWAKTGEALPGREQPPASEARAVPATTGRGSGLVAVVRFP